MFTGYFFTILICRCIQFGVCFVVGNPEGGIGGEFSGRVPDEWPQNHRENNVNRPDGGPVRGTALFPPSVL